MKSSRRTWAPVGALRGSNLNHRSASLSNDERLTFGRLLYEFRELSLGLVNIHGFHSILYELGLVSLV